MTSALEGGRESPKSRQMEPHQLILVSDNGGKGAQTSRKLLRTSYMETPYPKCRFAHPFRNNASQLALVLPRRSEHERAQSVAHAVVLESRSGKECCMRKTRDGRMVKRNRPKRDIHIHVATYSVRSEYVRALSILLQSLLGTVTVLGNQTSVTVSDRHSVR